MSKARTLANLMSDNAELADGQISVGEVVGAAPLASPDFTGTLSLAGTDLTPDFAELNHVNGVTSAIQTQMDTKAPSASPTFTGTVTTDVLNIDEASLLAIATDISDTAVDVFVYDTSKDSDGGAWRKRTQNTSWYNEAASATRGSRKEFPSVAVIVVNSDTGQNLPHITIYDGDDPDMAMWMEFTRVSQDPYLNSYTNGATMVGNYPVGAAFAKNGVLALGGTRSAGALSGLNAGLRVINFVSDSAIAHSNTDAYAFPNDISQRDILVDAAATSGAIVNANANDVAMTVLPNAPIDAATGLPVPTIAVATDAGVSVIKDDGTVVDITGTSQGSDMPVDQISFVGNHSVMFSHRYASEVSTIPSSDSTAAYYNQVPTFTGRITNSISHDDDTHLAALSSDNNIESIAIDEDNAVSKSVSGVSRHNHFAIAGDTDRASAFITSSYNTGWQVGDIKLATLSDTDDTNVTGAELVTNGTFASDTGWTKGTGWTISGGTAVASSVASGVKITSTAFTVTAGYYTMALDVTTSASTYFFGVQGATNDNTGALTTQGTVLITKYLNAGTHYAYIGAWSSGLSGTFDNFSIRKAEPDRSVNGNGVQVFGTVTKTAVDTGSDLVAYSGFTTSNYLKQPYNSDLDFNSGDFATCFWVNNPFSTTNYVWDRADNNGNYRIAIYVNAGANGTVNMYTQDGASNNSAVAGIIGTPNTWVQIWCIRRGTIHEIWVNGVNKVATSTTVRDVSSANGQAELNVGTRFNEATPNTGKLALLRISATAPSPEQIAKIYNDEKHLFQTGAQATLYGTSDAVTALAHDDSTDLLHVGTSAGRSVFQGLRRVENTTTAVGTTISASNGLVAED